MPDYYYCRASNSGPSRKGTVYVRPPLQGTNQLIQLYISLKCPLFRGSTYTNTHWWTSLFPALAPRWLETGQPQPGHRSGSSRPYHGAPSPPGRWRCGRGQQCPQETVWSAQTLSHRRRLEREAWCSNSMVIKNRFVCLSSLEVHWFTPSFKCVYNTQFV